MTTTVHDPVCGMDIEPQSAFTKREHIGQIFYFCSQSCVDQFDQDPHRYVMTSATTGFNPERTLTRVELPLSGLPLREHSTHLESTLRALGAEYSELLQAVRAPIMYRVAMTRDASGWVMMGAVDPGGLFAQYFNVMTTAK